MRKYILLYDYIYIGSIAWLGRMERGGGYILRYTSTSSSSSLYVVILFFIFGFGLMVVWLVIGRDAGRCTDLVGAMYLYRSFLGRLQWSVAITSTL
jgi:hypothetical protein